MLKQLFHASPSFNTVKIRKQGILRGIDGCVYLAETKEAALKFMAFRPYDAVTVFQIDATKLEQKHLDESIDHNKEFFGCTAYCYESDIPKEFIQQFIEYRR